METGLQYLVNYHNVTIMSNTNTLMETGLQHVTFQ